MRQKAGTLEPFYNVDMRQKQPPYFREISLLPGAAGVPKQAVQIDRGTLRMAQWFALRDRVESEPGNVIRQWDYVPRQRQRMSY
jgi:hypothetical protein